MKAIESNNYTIKELIEKLKEFDQDSIITTMFQKYDDGEIDEEFYQISIIIEKEEHYINNQGLEVWGKIVSLY